MDLQLDFNKDGVVSRKEFSEVNSILNRTAVLQISIAVAPDGVMAWNSASPLEMETTDCLADSVSIKQPPIKACVQEALRLVSSSLA